MEDLKENLRDNRTISYSKLIAISLSIILLYLSLFCVTVYAQTQEFGFGAGVITYKGELAPTFTYKTAKPALQLYYRHNFTPATVLRTNLLVGVITANSINSKSPTFTQITPSSFSTPLAELSAVGEYNFLDFRRTVKPDLFSPYLFGGVGFFYFKPTSENGKEASAFQPVVPFGAGCKFALGKNWNLNFETGFRKTFTKLLDGRNTQLPNTTYQTPGGQTVSYPSTQRGYSQEQDWYMFIGFNLSYTIFVIPCPNNQKGGWQPNPGEELGR